VRFLLFDKMLRVDPGKGGVGLKSVSLGEGFFAGHLGRLPTMPEPLIIESLAQVGGWIIAVSSNFQHVAIMVRLDKATFFRSVYPGDQLTLNVEITAMSEEASTIEGAVEVGGARVAQVDRLMYVLYPVPEHLRGFVKKGYITAGGGLLDGSGSLVRTGHP
jgi:3-hydroxyacyl-[acyl-carrier-protein] dehydratase